MCGARAKGVDPFRRREMIEAKGEG